MKTRQAIADPFRQRKASEDATKVVVVSTAKKVAADAGAGSSALQDALDAIDARVTVLEP